MEEGAAPSQSPPGSGEEPPELEVRAWPAWPRTGSIHGGGANASVVVVGPASLQSVPNKEAWHGRVVAVGSGKRRGDLARVVGSGSGWVQVRFVAEDAPEGVAGRDPVTVDGDWVVEVSKRAVDLLLCEVKEGDVPADMKMAVFRHPNNGANFTTVAFKPGEEDPHEMLERHEAANGGSSELQDAAVELGGAAAAAAGGEQRRNAKRRAAILAGSGGGDETADAGGGGGDESGGEEGAAYTRRKSRRAQQMAAVAAAAAAGSSQDSDEDNNNGGSGRPNTRGVAATSRARKDSMDGDGKLSRGSGGLTGPNSKPRGGAAYRPTRGGRQQQQQQPQQALPPGAQQQRSNGSAGAAHHHHHRGGGATAADDNSSDEDEGIFPALPLSFLDAQQNFKQTRYLRRQRALRRARRRALQNQSGDCRTKLEATRRARIAHIVDFMSRARDRLEKSMGMSTRPNLYEWLEKIQGSDAEEEDTYVPLLFDFPFCPVCCLEKVRDSDICWNPACWKSPVHYAGAPPLPGSAALPSAEHLNLSATLQSPRPSRVAFPEVVSALPSPSTSPLRLLPSSHHLLAAASTPHTSTTTTTTTTTLPLPSPRAVGAAMAASTTRFYAGRKRVELAVSFSPLVTLEARAPTHVLGGGAAPTPPVVSGGYFGPGWKQHGLLFELSTHDLDSVHIPAQPPPGQPHPYGTTGSAPPTPPPPALAVNHAAATFVGGDGDVWDERWASWRSQGLHAAAAAAAAAAAITTTTTTASFLTPAAPNGLAGTKAEPSSTSMASS